MILCFSIVRIDLSSLEPAFVLILPNCASTPAGSAIFLAQGAFALVFLFQTHVAVFHPNSSFY